MQQTLKIFLQSWRACNAKACIFVFADSEEIALRLIKAQTFLWKCFKAADAGNALNIWPKRGHAWKKERKKKVNRRLEVILSPAIKYALNVLTNLKYAASRWDATHTDVAVSPTVQNWSYNIQDTNAPTSPLGRQPRERAATPRFACTNLDWPEKWTHVCCREMGSPLAFSFLYRLVSREAFEGRVMTSSMLAGVCGRMQHQLAI